MSTQEDDLTPVERSRGVTMWAAAFIFYATWSMLALLKNPIKISMFKFFFVLQIIGYLAAGIYILQLKEFARKLVIALAIIGCISAVFLLPKQMKMIQEIRSFYQEKVDESYENRRQQIMKKTKPEFQQEELSRLDKEQKEANALMPQLLNTVVIIGAAGTIIINGIIIFYFMRPKVKRQFIN